MTLMNPATRICGALLLFVFSATAAHGQAVDVAIGNASNSALLWADFDGGEAIQLNTDANKSSGLRSVEYHFNTCDGPRLDIVAANTNGGDILLYAGGPYNAATDSGNWRTSKSLCSGGNCPQRPEGLSASNTGLLAAANTGAGGTVPELWFFEPTCGTDVPFKAGKRGGQFRVGGGPGTPVGTIVDTEFVRVPGGGLKVGDLLVTTASPSLIARVPAADIVKILAGQPVGPAQVLVPESFFGNSAPAGMAFVTGTSGVGSPTDATSESEALLVTVPPARVLKLKFGLTNFGSANLQNFVFFSEGLGNGPLGVAAGTRSELTGLATYMVVTDRQKGQAVRVRLNVSPNGELSLAPATPTIIKSNLQFPQGVAYNSNATAAGSCAGPEGCALSGALKLFLPSTLQGSDDVIIGQLYLVEDRRGTANTALALPAALGANYSLPATCRGFDLDDDASTPPIVPVVKLTKDFDPSPGELVNVQELLAGIFPQVQNCSKTGARIYHGVQAGALRDETIVCTNPSRIVNGGNFSPFAACADRDYNRNLTNQQQSSLKTEVFNRITRLENAVSALPPHAPYAVPRTDMLARIAVIREILKKPRPSQQEYRDASAEFSLGALQVYALKGAFGSDANLLPSTYGDLVMHWLSLGFYTSETAGKQIYCPYDDPGFAGFTATELPNLGACRSAPFPGSSPGS